MGGNCGVACFVSHLDCLKGLRYRTDLVQFDQDGVSAAKRDTLCQTLGIGYKQVVSDKLYFSAKLCGQLFPAFPVFFIQCVLDGDDRVFLYQCFPVSDQLFGSKYSAGFRQFILALGTGLPLGGSSVHSDLEVPAWLIACFFHCLKNGLNGFFIGFQSRCKTAFISNRCCQSALF